MHGAFRDVELFSKSLKRVAHVTGRRYPYALSEIRAYYHCGAPRETMTTRAGADELARIVSEDAKLTVVRADPVFLGGEGVGHGYTLNCTLMESGVAFDCWPEYGTVIQYLDLCNVEKDNSYKAHLLFKHVAYYFKAKWYYSVGPIFIPVNPAHLDEAHLIPVE